MNFKGPYNLVPPQLTDFSPFILFLLIYAPISWLLLKYYRSWF